MHSRIIFFALAFLILSDKTLYAGMPRNSSFNQNGASHSRQREIVIQDYLLNKSELHSDHVLMALLESDIKNFGYASSNSNVNAGNYEEDEFDLEEEFEDVSAKKVFDPLSGYNRFMTNANDKFYFWVAKPVANGYRKVVPESPRRAIVRFFNNLLFPVRFVNNLLQLKFKRSVIEMARFGLNSTVGILGFTDPAKNWFDLEAYPEDFGQTLGRYGVGSGFHIVLPILGPSNLRDLVGMVPDYFLEPISYIGKDEDEIIVRSVDELNKTSIHIGEYENIKKDALDLYTFLRDSYEQNREKQIRE